jgi:hypothetical protein
VPEPRQISFRSQQDFKQQLISSLLAIERDSKICLKRRIGRISREAEDIPVGGHKLVRFGGKKGRCMSYKGLRFIDRPQKRVTLAEITANQQRESERHDSRWGCDQCDVYLYKERGCFDVFHREK